MFYSRAAIVASALFLQTTIPSAAITNEQANAIKERLLHGPLAALMVTCSEGWQFKVNSVACAMAMRIIINELEERGHFGRHICPPLGTTYGPAFDAISEYITVTKPAPDERAVDVTLSALMRAYPCRQATRAKSAENGAGRRAAGVRPRRHTKTAATRNAAHRHSQAHHRPIRTRITGASFGHARYPAAGTRKAAHEPRAAVRLRDRGGR
jgi:hypothetical protein